MKQAEFNRYVKKIERYIWMGVTLEPSTFEEKRDAIKLASNRVINKIQKKPAKRKRPNS